MLLLLSSSLTTHLATSGHCREAQRRELVGWWEVPFSRVFLHQKKKKNIKYDRNPYPILFLVQMPSLVIHIHSSKHKIPESFQFQPFNSNALVGTGSQEISRVDQQKFSVANKNFWIKHKFFLVAITMVSTFSFTETLRHSCTYVIKDQ